MARVGCKGTRQSARRRRFIGGASGDCSVHRSALSCLHLAALDTADTAHRTGPRACPSESSPKPVGRAQSQKAQRTQSAAELEQKAAAAGASN